MKGRAASMREFEMMAPQHKAAKGDVAASRQLAKLRADAGVDDKEQFRGGVLAIPSAIPLHQWEISAAIQQAQFREKPTNEDGEF